MAEPQHNMATWSSQYDAIQRLLDWLPTTFGDLRAPTPNSDMASAAAVARCTRLLRGVTVLFDAGGCEDLLPLFVRPIVETWLVGTYVHVEGNVGWERLRAAHRRELALLERDSGLDLGLLEAFPARKGPTVPEMLVTVQRRLEEVSDSTAGLLQAMYWQFFRPTSMADVHGGAGALYGHLEQHAGFLRVITVRPGGPEPPELLLWCALLVGNLADRVFGRFRRDELRSELQEIVAPLEVAYDL